VHHIGRLLLERDSLVYVRESGCLDSGSLTELELRFLVLDLLDYESVVIVVVIVLRSIRSALEECFATLFE